MKHPILNLPVMLAAVLCLAASTAITAVVFNPPQPPTRLLDQPLDCPDFTVTDHHGNTLTRKDMLGKVWVCDFFLTRCTGICPLLGDRMSEIAYDLEQDPKLKDVQLISFSVDPEHDRPEQLRIYRQRYVPAWSSRIEPYEQRKQAIESRWRHTTAQTPDQDAFWAMVETGFHLMVGPADPNDPNPSTPIAHSSKLVLIDRQGRIRGYYDGLLPEESGEPLMADIKRVVQEQ